MKTIRDGIWVPMLTPFDRDNKIDYAAVKALLDFYADHGVDGVFVDCQSNEIFQMSMAERVELAAFVMENRSPSLDVVIGATAYDDPAAQTEEIQALSALEADSYVLITGLLAGPNDPDETLWANLTRILDRFPDLPFGLYECPKPYKRLLSPDLMRRCAQTGRINFMKETSCDERQAIGKIEAVQGTDTKIFNANTVTLLDTIYGGVNGYCGPMCNFHSDLYATLWKIAQTSRDDAARLHQMLSLFSLAIYQCWPVSAKYYLQLEGLPFSCKSRVQDENLLNYSKMRELDTLYDVTKRLRDELAGRQ